MVQTRVESVPRGEYVPEADGRVVMRLDWEGFEQLLGARGGRRRPRVAYLDGVAELTSPSPTHETLSRRLFYLLGKYLELAGVEFDAAGSWLMREREKKAGLEPDETFIFGPPWMPHRAIPDLAVEVVWTSGGLEKLEIYRRLGIPEVWFWIDGVIHAYVLGKKGYHEVERSMRLPELDLVLLARLMEIEPVTEAVRQLSAALAASK